MSGRADKIDWLDIGLHAAVAFFVVSLSYFGLPLFALVLANLIFWPARELWQHRPDYTEIFTREQPFLEWMVPVCVSVITALLVMAAQP